jgi:hypothetical protein
MTGSGSQTLRSDDPMARWESAIARRNIAWVAYREAQALLESAERRGYLDVGDWIRDLNDASRDYEWAARNLIRENVRRRMAA